MKKKGFTLIELLAVIVILAIIALIATPTILGVIESARKGAAESSALNYIDAVEKYIILSELDSDRYPIKLENGKKYPVSNESTEITFLDYFVEQVKAENIEIALNDIIDIKGEKPTKGWLEIKSNKVADYSLKVGDYAVNYDSITKKAEVIRNGNLKEETEEIVYSDGTVVYFNPVMNEICSADQAISTTETKNGCMKWYIFGDDKYTSTVNMILDHNTTALVAWNTDTTTIEASEAQIALENDIALWDESVKSTARFIEADEIADITGASSEATIKWNSNKEEYFNSKSGEDLNADIDTEISWFYFDGQGTTYNKSENGWQLATATTAGASEYAWLYDNLSGCLNYGCNNEDNELYPYFDGLTFQSSTNKIIAYWTNTPFKKGIAEGESNNYVWAVEYRGSLSRATAVHSIFTGIRPVITIDKEKLS